MVRFEQIVKKIWKKPFEYLLISCIIFLVIYTLYCLITGKKGSWGDNYHYIPSGGKGLSPRWASASKGEAECRYVLEKMFSKPFPRRKPKFMFNSETGANLELDMYNKELGIACEYNGKQHYEYIPYFHSKGKTDLYAQKRRDVKKREICSKLGIQLIIVPYTVKEKNISNYIINELKIRELI